MQRSLIFTTLFLLAGVAMMTSCQKEYFELKKLSGEVELQPELVAPVCYGSLTMKDLVAYMDSGGYAHEFEDGLIYLAYADTVVHVMADTIIDIPDNLNTEVYLDPEVNNPEFIGSGIDDMVHFPKSKFIVFELDGDDRVDSARIKGGEILIRVKSAFKHDGYVNISSEQILDSRGDPFFATLEGSNISGEFEDSVRVFTDNYYIETFEKGDSNVIQIDFDLVLTNSGNPVSPGEKCEIDLHFRDMDFYSIFGYIDSRNTFEESGSLDIPFYADYPDLAALTFADPRINVFSINSAGIPFVIELDSVIATGLDGSTDMLEFYEGHPFMVPAPDLSSIGESLSEEFHVNRETSNFNELLALAPTSLSYKVKGSTQQGTGNESHFALDTSRLLIESEFMLPLDFRSTVIALEGTYEFEIGEERIDTSRVVEARVSLSTVNELPLRLDLQVYLLDEFQQVMDSLFGDEHVILAASEVDAEGRLAQAGEVISTADFPPEKLGKLEEVSYFQVHARVITSEQGSRDVKVYSDYSLDFDLSVFAIFRINSREL
ncbi:MAG: hypothetical protein ABFS28_01550 [Bacteroidota bacterium]